MTMPDFIEIRLDGSCNGAYPVDCGRDEFINEPWYEELVKYIEQERTEDAEKPAQQHMNAEYLLENVPALEELGFIYQSTCAQSVSSPFLENDDGFTLPLFRWFGAEFILKAPVSAVLQWVREDIEGRFWFDQDLFDTWREDNDCMLQDGCIYRLGEILYDLDGFGENSCILDAFQLEDGLNRSQQNTKRAEELKQSGLQLLEGKQLLAKVAELGDSNKEDIVRECGYAIALKNGEEWLNHTGFYNALMKAKGIG